MTIDLKCAYFPLCSGCQFHKNVVAPPVWGEVKEFFNHVAPHLSTTLNIKELTGWRSRSKLAVRGKSLKPEIGLFKRGSHDVVSIPMCPLHHPSINEACSIILEAIIKNRVEPYSELTLRGALRYLQFAVDRSTGKVQLVLVVNLHPHQKEQIQTFVKQLYSTGKFHSIWLNYQVLQTNTIFGDRWELAEGEEYLWERLHRRKCAFHPACFGQAHLSIFEEVLKEIEKEIHPHQRVVELYAGVGVIGLNVLDKSTLVKCVEINPFARAAFDKSWNVLSDVEKGKISLQVSSSEDAIELIEQSEVIIVDPPRKGLEPKVLEQICSAKRGTQLIYLSCGPKSFQRDCQALVAKGWIVENAKCYLFFPGTDHVEILAFFQLENSKFFSFS